MKPEISRKLELVRRALATHGHSGAHFRGVDWFAWITGGGTSSVIMTNEIGVAEVFVSLNDAWVLTNTIEHQRLVEEEIPDGFKVTRFAWQDPKAIEEFVASQVVDHVGGMAAVVSDRPCHGELSLPSELLKAKAIMCEEEKERYRRVSRLAAEAMTEALRLAQPDWTENQLAGAGARALWSRGLEPTLVMAAGEKRGQVHRHPIAKDSKLGGRAMLVFCARGFGLYANLTRFVFFRDILPEEAARFAALDKVEAAAFAAAQPGQNLSTVYSSLAHAYKVEGLGSEIDLHHQGGPCGYLSREKVASILLKPQDDWTIENGMAFAWNPSLPGAKVEDTVLLSEKGLEVLTVDPEWPTQEVAGLKRPRPWVRK